MFEDFFRKEFNLNRIAKIIFALLIIVLIFWGLGALSTILIPFGLAWILAYMLMPIVYFLEEKVKIKSRPVNIIIVLTILTGILVGVFAILIPSLIDESKKAWELIQYYDIGGLLVSIIPEELRTKSEFFTSLEGLLASINLQEFIAYIQNLLTGSWKIVQNTLSYLSGMLVILIFLAYLIFIMLDYEALVRGFFSMCPRSTRPFMHELAANVEFYINSYFKGQALISLICGVILAIGFALMGLPLGITFGLFMGLLNMIPYLQYIGYFPLLILVGLQAAATGQNFFIILLIAAGVIFISEIVQQVILIPTIQGKSMGMKPAMILLSLTIWGSLFGFMGLLFALPLSMIIYTFYMKYVIGEPIANGTQIRRTTRKKLSDIFHHENV
ncbi:AI-2E family transporter [Porphyromonadaceae bacterium W3.11]|nr:AI-2E family transporter [Porphyromonadaceae bacterium W3.11]